VLSSRLRLSVGRRDPWWDLEGASARRDRRLRRLLEVVVLIAVLLLVAIVFNQPAMHAATAVLLPV
jgi:hypothetical protein